MEASHLQNRDFDSERGGVARGMSHFRGFIVFLSVLGVLLLAAIYFADQQIDPVIQALIDQRFNDHLSEQNSHATIGSAKFVEGTGILIDDIVIHDISGKNKSVIATVEQLLLKTSETKLELASGECKLQRIVVSGLQLHVRRDTDGWNIQQLFGKENQQNNAVPIAIRDSQLHLYGTNSASRSLTEIHDIHFDVIPHLDAQGKTQFKMRGSFSGDDIGLIKLVGGFQTSSKKWGLAGSVEDLRVSRKLLNLLPQSFKEKRALLESVSGKVACKFHAGGTGFQSTPHYKIAGEVIEGNIVDDRLPCPFSNLTAKFELDNGRVTVSHIHADSSLGPVELSLNKKMPSRAGIQQNSQLAVQPDGKPIVRAVQHLESTEKIVQQESFELTAQMKKLYLNDRLAASIPQEAQDLWHEYSPAGPVDVNVKLNLVDGNWVPTVEIKLHGVSFAYHEMPYRLENAHGIIQFSGGRLTARITAMAAGARVHITGDFNNPGPRMVGQMEVKVDGSIPIDEKLISSLQARPKLYQTVRSFHPTGFFNVNGTYARYLDQNNKIREDTKYDVDIHGAAVNYERFQYPFTNITGRISVHNQNIQYRNIEGQNDAGYVVCNGSLNPQEGLKLVFNGRSIELEKELKLALPVNTQKVWDHLRPRGSIDQVTLLVSKPPARPLSVSARFEKLKPDKFKNSETVSFFPTWFPYRTSDVHGVIDYHDGEIQIHHLTGHHGSTRLSVAGNCACKGDNWKVDLKKLTFDRLRADTDFTEALPEKFRSAIKGLKIKGMMNVSGSLQVHGSKPADSQVNVAHVPQINSASFASMQQDAAQVPSFHWDLQVNMADGKILTGLPLTNIYGGARFIGTSSKDGFFSSGRIDVDSLLCRGVPLTKLAGPIWIDETRIGLGSWAVPVKIESERQLLTANMFGGKLTFDAFVALSEGMPFQIQADLNRSDLRHAMEELSPRTKNIEGLGFAKLNLTGNSKGTHTYSGDGSIHLTKAKISEVPVMLAMLKLLSIKKVNRTAFNESNIEFNIEGEHLYFKKLEFLGDAISLKGNGEMSFEQDISLNFYTGVGKRSFRIPVISPIFGRASQNILLVQVNGTLDRPRVSKELFPGFTDALHEIFPDVVAPVQEK